MQCPEYRWANLSIFGPAFGLMRAARLVAQAAGLALVASQRSGAGVPVPLSRVARALRQEMPVAGPYGPAGAAGGLVDPAGRGGPDGLMDGGFAGGGPPPDAPGPPPQSGLEQRFAAGPRTRTHWIRHPGCSGAWRCCCAVDAFNTMQARLQRMLQARARQGGCHRP